MDHGHQTRQNAQLPFRLETFHDPLGSREINETSYHENCASVVAGEAIQAREWWRVLWLIFGKNSSLKDMAPFSLSGFQQIIRLLMLPLSLPLRRVIGINKGKPTLCAFAILVYRGNVRETRAKRQGRHIEGGRNYISSRY